MNNAHSTISTETLPDTGRVPMHLRVASTPGISASEMYKNPYESGTMFQTEECAKETLAFFGGLGLIVAAATWLLSHPAADVALSVLK